MIFFYACSGPKEKINFTKYPDVERVFEVQLQKISSKQLKKQIHLNNQTEEELLDTDSAMLTTELSFLKEINPSQPRYVGAFDEESSEGRLKLSLKEGEKGSLKTVEFLTKENEITSINAFIFEDRNIYTHSEKINIQFLNGVLSHYKITGQQKMLFSDTVQYTIDGHFVY